MAVLDALEFAGQLAPDSRRLPAWYLALTPVERAAHEGAAHRLETIRFWVVGQEKRLNSGPLTPDERRLISRVYETIHGLSGDSLVQERAKDLLEVVAARGREIKDSEHDRRRSLVRMFRWLFGGEFPEYELRLSDQTILACVDAWSRPRGRGGKWPAFATLLTEAGVQDVPRDPKGAARKRRARAKGGR